MYPIITQYQSGIQEDALHCLILPLKEDMELLDEIVAYFSSRNRRALETIGILTAEITPGSFPSVFAAQDQTMIKLREDILYKTEVRVEARRVAREEYWRLLSKQGQNCSCDYNQGAKKGKRKVTRCPKCELESEDEKVVERLLPQEEYLQYAVIFELLIPQLVSDLRDCLAMFKYILLQEVLRSNKLLVKWRNYGNLREFIPRATIKEIDRTEFGLIVMGSKQRNVATKKENLALMLADEDDFIVENRMGCVYNFNCLAVLSSKRTVPVGSDRDQALLNQCMFKISTADNSEPYLSLEKYLVTWNHSQNEVIADQNSCHVGLSLREFITFGSVRAGCRIQLRNLYRGIVSRSLSLEEEPVLQLILQTIWQVGPSSHCQSQSQCSQSHSGESGGGREWEAHLDFEDKQFSSAMLDALEELAEVNKPNYSRPLLLMSAVVITVRVMELNRGMFELGYILLKRWRGLMTQWIEKIELEMEQRNLLLEDLKELRKILLQIRICYALSFHFSLSMEWKKIMRDTEDVVGWLHTISSLNETDEEEGETETEGSVAYLNISEFMQFLLSIGKGLALRLKLEEEVISHPILREALRQFVSQKRRKAREFEESNLEYVSGTNGQKNLVRLVCVEREDLDQGQNYQTYRITFDLILGIFLVNGYPESRLTADVLRSVKFKRFFGHSSQLRVWKESDMVSKSVGRFHGKQYTFERVNQGEEEEVVIKEVPDDGGAVLSLIDHRKLAGTISETLIENYTHWWDPQGKVCYFRRKPTQESDYDLSYEYRLIQNETSTGWHLHDEKNGSRYLNIKSAGFEAVGEALKRLELSRYLNVMLDDQTSNVVIHLPRYGLRFTLEKGGLECKEHPGLFLLGAEQQAGEETLLGLEQSIQLMTERGKKRVWIVPNGKIFVVGAGSADGGKSHQKVGIDMEELRQPPYFTYAVDLVLKRLVAKKSRQAWLYLAALHGVTSGPLPDPFTGVTGTEMAVRILQSGFIWSGEPYDEECLRILEFIRGLSPRRSYYWAKPPVVDGKGGEVRSIEVIKWPEGLPSLAAYDGYDIIVGKLQEDSLKLEALHREIKVSKRKKYKKMGGSSQRLRLRGYFHHLNLYGGAAVEPNYFKESLVLLKERSVEGGSRKLFGSREGECSWEAVVKFASSMLSLQHFDFDSRQRAAPFQQSNHRPSFTFSYYKLETRPELEETGESSVKSIFVSEVDLKSKWLALYGKATDNTKNEKDQLVFGLILSYLAYKKAPLDQILDLLYISAFADRINFPRRPEAFPAQAQLTNPCSDEKETAIAEALEQNRIKKQGDDENETEIKAKIEDMTKLLLGPEYHETVDRFGELHPEVGMDREAALRQVKSLISHWDRSRELEEFVADVHRKLREVHDWLVGAQQDVFPCWERNVGGGTTVQVGGVGLEEGEVDLDSFFNVGLLNSELWEEAKLIFQTGKIRLGGIDGLTVCGRKVANILQNITDMMSGDNLTMKIIHLTGSCPRTDPTSMLRRLLRRPREGEGNESVTRIYAGALAVLWTHLQRYIRISLLDLESPGAKRETANEGYKKWTPQEHPEWVVLQLELNLMIRRLQVSVAQQMMQMPNGKSGVMQLNMGEGKTSVIVPMLCLALGRGEMLCRVTVLESIFHTNYAILSFAIGGLLNRRIYTFPCRRNMDIRAAHVEIIQKTYEECMRMGGVVLTLPEYRLSFRLLSYYQLRMETDQSYALGMKLRQTENWLREHARDVLDESDELLQVKYQLVYTVGEQISLDGGELRWTVCQKLLRIVEELGREFLETHGPSKIELDGESWSQQKPHHFPRIRLLDAEINGEFVGAVADRYLAEVAETSDEKQRTKQFLTEEVITKERMEETLGVYEDTPELLQCILLVSGFLRRGVLPLGLSKRWRVEYGVDTAKGFKRMAVPFRAKDVAAERTEFGHPDLAILLTHLSYYYSGLSDKELFETFEVLEENTGSEEIYSEWIKLIPRDEVSEDLLAFRGINLKDTIQRRKLFQLIRKHKLVVDFWLSNKVFPREAKQFPAKMVMTGWDLCYERAQHPVTGFSGTNDSSVLLPLNITQQDLPALPNTNTDRKNDLLRKENNNGHHGLEIGATCTQILTRMREDGLMVLIDAGALMLDCDNGQLASKWLEIDPGLEAVVYFNPGNELMVKSRRAAGQQDDPFELSSFKGRLGQCGVYLDDQHTRGTDLGFPKGSRACVTVGGNMRTDKLIQACWRMRQIGWGHYVTFYLSHEAHTKVNGRQEGITTKQVLDWVDGNTLAYNDDGLLYWAQAGRNYAQRLAAEDNFDTEGIQSIRAAGSLLGEMCVDVDVSSLKELYGQHSKIDLLVNVIPLWFQTAMSKLKLINEGCDLPPKVLSRFEGIREQVTDRCREYVPNKSHHALANMEEEQERENEEEHEEERKIERPGKAFAVLPSLHKNVREFVLQGSPLQTKEGIMRLCDIFNGTPFGEEVQEDGWGNEVFATTDFITVINEFSHYICESDLFLRPIEYLISVESQRKSRSKPSQHQLLLLSPFEVNEMMPQFRSGEVACRLHMFSLRGSKGADLLLNNSRLMLPHSVPVAIPENSRITAALLIASGSLYFGSMEEQKAFINFLSLAPMPWTEEEVEAVRMGLIKKTGFMLPQYEGRHRHDPYKGFKTDPTWLVRKILMARHPALSGVAHVVRLLDEKKLVPFVEREVRIE